MPNLASWHPQIVHFVVALLFVGLAMRLVAFTPYFRFTNYAATTLLVVGTIAAILAVKSGLEAHDPVERIPGTRPLVVEHEEGGETTRNIFIAVSLLELAALGLTYRGTWSRYARYLYVGSAALGIWGAAELFETAEHGGELVYSYGGGPGLRTGDPQDVQRLLLAGLYSESRIDRREGRGADAAVLVNEMARRFPGDTSVRFLHAESLLLDSKNPRAALAAVDSIRVAPKDGRLRSRQAALKADIYLALGQADSARAFLSQAIADFPQNTRLKTKLDSIAGGGARGGR